MTKSRLTLLDKLERIDAALLEGTATRAQENAGLQLARLADAAPAMLKALTAALPFIEEYARAGDSAWLLRVMRSMRKAIRLAQYGDN